MSAAKAACAEEASRDNSAERARTHVECMQSGCGMWDMTSGLQ
jgi:hypothetical protein